MLRMRRAMTAMGMALATLSSCAQAPAGVSAPAVREIVDAATGNCWLLERQAAGAPGRLVLVAGGAAAAAQPGSGKGLAPVIRAGTPVTLVAHTAVLDAELEATALTTAMAGAELKLRLKIGGRVVRGIALGPGRAEWLPESAAANGVKP